MKTNTTNPMSIRYTRTYDIPSKTIEKALNLQGSINSIYVYAIGDIRGSTRCKKAICSIITEEIQPKR